MSLTSIDPQAVALDVAAGVAGSLIAWHTTTEVGMKALLTNAGSIAAARIVVAAALPQLAGVPALGATLGVFFVIHFVTDYFLKKSSQNKQEWLVDKAKLAAGIVLAMLAIAQIQAMRATM